VFSAIPGLLATRNPVATSLLCDVTTLEVVHAYFLTVLDAQSTADIATVTPAHNG
jgi:hypothetical protein